LYKCFIKEPHGICAALLFYIPFCAKVVYEEHLYHGGLFFPQTLKLAHVSNDFEESSIEWVLLQRTNTLILNETLHFYSSSNGIQLFGIRSSNSGTTNINTL
jgi:hypothetical protein